MCIICTYPVQHCKFIKNKRRSILAGSEAKGSTASLASRFPYMDLLVAAMIYHTIVESVKKLALGLTILTGTLNTVSIVDFRSCLI
jgi:hypothetical protein